MAIKWRLPDPNEPGYLRRRRALTHLLDAPPTTDAVDALVGHLSQYVEEPSDPKEAIEAILDLQGDEYRRVIVTLFGYEVPPPFAGRSATR